MHISVDSHILLYTLGYHPILCYLYCPSNLFQFVSRSFSDFLLEFQGPFYCISAWKIPWMEKPSGLQFMGSLRVGHDWATSLSLFTFLHWRRRWQPTPVFLPGESQGWGSLVGCHLSGRTESDTTEATQQQQQHHYTHFTNGGIATQKS